VDSETLKRRPLVSLVTNRARFHASGTTELETLHRQVSAAVVAGVDLIQIREADLPDRLLFDLVSCSVDIARGTGSVILVNERFDIALAAGAGGTHLRASSLPAQLLRPHLPPGFVLGRSVHDAGEAVRAVKAGGLDYVTLGTMFPSASHPGGRVCGSEALKAAAHCLTLPILAIGGVTADKLETLFEAGAAGVAAIGMFADAGPLSRFDGLGSVVSEIRRTFMECHGQRN
jgi:thiamine-phosphate pyrophosphorylase